MHCRVTCYTRIFAMAFVVLVPGFPYDPILPFKQMLFLRRQAVCPARNYRQGHVPLDDGCNADPMTSISGQQQLS